MLQYEDPTEDLQTIRERVELRRAVKLPWLMELAAKVAQAAASALPANGHAQVAHLAARMCLRVFVHCAVQAICVGYHTGV